VIAGAPLQRGRRRDGENSNIEDYYGVDEKGENDQDSEDDESYEIDQGPNPAEQYGLQVKRLSAGSKNGGINALNQPRISPSLEKYKNMARKIKTGVAHVSNSPIKEVSLTKIKA